MPRLYTVAGVPDVLRPLHHLNKAGFMPIFLVDKESGFIFSIVALYKDT